MGNELKLTGLWSASWDNTLILYLRHVGENQLVCARRYETVSLPDLLQKYYRYETVSLPDLLQKYYRYETVSLPDLLQKYYKYETVSQLLC